MARSWFQKLVNRWSKSSRSEPRKPRGRRVFDLLEERVVLNNTLIVPAGLDQFETATGNQNFGGTPIPAGFFGPGSDPFTGIVSLGGNTAGLPDTLVQRPPSTFLPTNGPANGGGGGQLGLEDSRLGPLGTDTVIRRLDHIELPGIGSLDMVPIELVGLSLVSLAPITVTYNGGMNPEQWNVQVQPAPTQTQGAMNVQRTSPVAGTFNATLPVQSLFVFTRIGPPATTPPLPVNQTFTFNGNFQTPLVFPDTRTTIQLNTPLGPETIEFFGPKSVLVNLPPDGSATDNNYPNLFFPPNGRDDVSTNMFQLDMTGVSPTFGPVTMRLRPGPGGFGNAFGVVDEQVNSTPGKLDFLADSFFDVFVEIQFQNPVGPFGTTFRNSFSADMNPVNDEPIRMQSLISDIPPAVNETYNMVSPPRVLRDASENPVPITLTLATCVPRPECDFGDAPDKPYPTLLVNDGARHLIVPGAPRLGPTEDGEPDGQPHPSALGDDLSPVPDDEDGVSVGPMIAGGLTPVIVTRTGAAGRLDAWVDFNQDGDWTDPGEQVFTSLSLGAGANVLSFSVPISYSPSKLTFSRWRISTAGGLKPTGFARDGEVEDYAHQAFLHGQKWNDVNANGFKDGTDVGINNVTIGLYNAAGTTLLNTAVTMDMDLDGTPGINPQTERGIYWFPNLPPGIYRVREEPSNSFQTYPRILGNTEYLVQVGDGSDIGIAPAQDFPIAGPGPHWVDHSGTPFVESFFDVFFSVADIDLVMGTQTLTMFASGQTHVERSQPYELTPSSCEFGTVDTEMKIMDLRGSHPAVGDFRIRAGVGAGLALPTLGMIQEQLGNPALADSFFDVFFEIDLPMLGTTLHNSLPLQVSAPGLTRLPPINVPYLHPMGPIQLYDPSNNPTGISLTRARHRPTTGLDFGNCQLDFGDAPDVLLSPTDYPTVLASDGARHIITGLRMGPTIDPEADGQPNATATGDDIAGLVPDDEDGVSIGPLVQGSGATVTVTASAPGELDAWIDFNDDSDWADPGEQIFDDFPLVVGPNILPFAVPGGPASVATPQTFSRWRFSTAGVLSFTGLAPDGEVEDYQVAIQAPAAQLDFGDAPDPTFPTLLASSGARHVITGLKLGPTIDAEADGQPNASATGDDIAGAIPDDEDGVVFTSAIVPSGIASVIVTASAPGKLDAWFDFNTNGSWADPGEQIFDDFPLGAGPNPLFFAVPGSASLSGTAISRWRLSTAGVVSFTGLAPDGEVEDHTKLLGVDGTPPTGKLKPVTGTTALEFNFNEPVTGFDPGDIVITRDGATLTLSGSETLTPSSGGATWTLGSLGSLLIPAGTYGVKVTAPAGIADGAGNPMGANIESFFDIFDQVGGTPLGASWTTNLGTFSDITNTIRANAPISPATSPVTNVATLTGLSIADVAVQAQVILVPSGGFRMGGVVARYSGPGDSNFYWGGLVRYSSTVLKAEIWKSGALTPLASVAATLHTSTIKFEVVGTSLKLSGDGFTTLSVNDGSFTTGTVGLRGTKDTRWNDFNVCRVPAVSVSLPFADDFGTGATLSGAWSTKAGSYATSSTTAVGSAPFLNLATLNGISVADVSVQAEVSVPAVSGKYAAVVARHSGPGDSNMYMANIFHDGSGFKVQLWKNVSGTWSTLVSLPVGTGTGELRFRLIGSSLKVFFGGALAISVTDASIPAAGSVGIRSSTTSTIDDFVAQAIVPASASLPFTDAFTQSDGSSLSSFWTEQVGTVTAFGNKAFLSGNSTATLNGVSIGPVTVQADVSVTGAGTNFAGLVARFIDNNYYWAGLISSGGLVYAQITKVVAGVPATLISSVSLGAGPVAGTLKFELIGTTLNLYLGAGPALLTTTDPDLVLGTVGIRGSSLQTFDNFSAT